MPFKIIPYFLIIISIIYPKINNAQELIVYDETTDLLIEYKYNSYESDSSLPNLFINELSSAQSKMRSFFKYGLNTKSKTTLRKNGNKYYLNIEIDTINIIGDYNYKGFDFVKSCLPKSIFYSYTILENNSKSTHIHRIPIKVAYKQRVNFDTVFVDSTNIASYTISNEKLNFKFDNNQKKEFYNSINYIKQYYKDGKIIKGINKDLSKLDTTNIDKLLLQSIDIKYIKRRFDKIIMNEYEPYLSLKKTDPEKIYSDYKATEKSVENLYSFYFHQINILDSLYYSRGMMYKEDNDISQSMEYFNKSIDFSPDYIPALYEIALYNYDNKDFIETEKYINRILAISTINKMANKLAMLNYNAMLQKGIELNNEENYTGGLEMLEKAKSFCQKNIHVMDCESYQDSAINNSKLGIYTSYISIAGASMRRGRFDMTESYLDAASSYQKKFPEAIESNAKANNLYTSLITQYLRLSIEATSKYKLKDAEGYLNHADSIAKVHSLNDALSFVESTKQQLSNKDYSASKIDKEIIARNEAIEQQEYNYEDIEEINPELIAKNSYLLHYNKGVLYIESNKYDKAFSNLEEAKNIKQKYNISENDSLDLLLYLSAKRLVIDKLQKANIHAWAYRFKTAEILLEDSKKIIEEYNLQNDLQIISSLKKLNKEMLNKANSKQSIAYNANMLKARKSIDFKDYRSMSLYCDSAIQIADKHPQIPLNVEYPKSLNRKYATEIEYQQIIEKVKLYCNSKAYVNAIDRYTASNKLIENKSVVLNIFTLSDFAKYANSKQVFDFSIQEYLDITKTERALDIWKIAIDNNIRINGSLAQNIMYELGKKDINIYPNSNKKSLYYLRFGDNKEYKSYKKHYYKGLKDVH